MRTRYVKTIETFSEHSKTLAPLNIRDHVFLQNQSGNAPGKWDRSGVVIEPKNHDQYLVKIDWTTDVKKQEVPQMVHATLSTRPYLEV